MNLELPLWAQHLLIVAYVLPAGWMIASASNLYLLIFFSLRRRRQMLAELKQLRADFARRFTDADLPAVTTQIPVYNEVNVVERCMRACAAMDYPRHLHTIQVLDDSTDATRDVVDRVASELRAKGHRVEVLRRDNRAGYKAGALDAGMAASSDEFFAIFDADFVPPADFLRRTVEVLLMREDVGMVQARWGHLNEAENILTRAQGIGIDGHFMVEQTARAWNDLIMNFNGTAGMWRRAAIEDAGGWQHDTLTEDLDLSYRAQLHRWKPYFLPDVVVPAEIPGNINAFKSQQFRWAKGSIETARKLLPKVLAADLPWFTKLQSVFHMTNYLSHPIMLWMSILTLPVLTLTGYSLYSFISVGIILLALATFAPTVMYVVSQYTLHPRPGRKLWMLPLLCVLGVGIAISNSQAVWQALRGRKTPFIRTPKRGDRNSSAVTYTASMPRLVLVEILLGIYCMATAVVYFQRDQFWVVPFLLIYGLGFTWVGGLSFLQHAEELRRAAA